MKSDLRIGNYVLDGGEIIILNENYTLFRALVNVDRGIGIKRIEITEQRLLDLGFEKYEGSDIPTYFKNFGNHDGEDFEYCFMIFQDAKDNFYTEIMGKKIILESVHQLQNIFFDVTGEELIFNIK